MAVESGSLFIVLLVELIFWGVLLLVGGVYYLWTSSQDERPKTSDARKTICAKKVRILRRDMSLYSTIAYFSMFVAALLVMFEIGTTTRPNGGTETVNWSYLALTAFAWAALGFLHAYYFWFPYFGQTLALALMWWGSFALLAVGPLWNAGQSRDIFFGLAVALQGISLGFIVWFQGRCGPMWRWRGWATAAGVILAVILIDIFWYIGYLNANRSVTAVDHRWVSHMVFFIANALALVVSAAVAAWTYKAKKADIDATIAELKGDAEGARDSQLLDGTYAGAGYAGEMQ